MKPAPRRIVPLTLALAGLLFLVAALKPAAQARSIDFPYLVFSIAFFLLAFAVLRGSGDGAA